MRYQYLVNIALRGMTLLSKFLLVFFLAKFLEPREVGVYGLLTAAIGYGIYFVGFEFYTYSSRELISAIPAERSKILKNQMFLYSIWYGFAVFVLFVLAATRVLPEGYWVWVLVLLILEHFAQELNRVLVALSQQLYASFVLFVRMGLWGVLVIATQWILPEARTIEFVLMAWLAGVLLACVLGVVRVSTLVPSWRSGQIDIAWIKSGLKIALPFFVASVALRGLATFDRFFVEQIVGLEVVAAYVLFIGMATAVISFIDAGIVDFAYPKLIAAARAKDQNAFLFEMNKVKNNLFWLGGLLIVLCSFGGYFIVDILGRDVYIENIDILYWLLLATALNVLSIVPHLGLYALGYDQAIVRSQVIGFAAFLLLVIMLPTALGIKSVLISICVAWLIILTWKAASYRIALSKFNL
jgi:O-antigen/teichoic acid export membrane protein